jgi:transketolase
MVLADTVKGKGVSFMEDVRSWHADIITPTQYQRVIAELAEPLP